MRRILPRRVDPQKELQNQKDEADRAKALSQRADGVAEQARQAAAQATQAAVQAEQQFHAARDELAAAQARYAESKQAADQASQRESELVFAFQQAEVNARGLAQYAINFNNRYSRYRDSVHAYDAQQRARQEFLADSLEEDFFFNG